MGYTIGGPTSCGRGATLALAAFSSSVAFAKRCAALCRFGATLALTAFSPSVTFAEGCPALCRFGAALVLTALAPVTFAKGCASLH
eukprot:1180290-Prorocentrum_minimum.AAC.3